MKAMKPWFHNLKMSELYQKPLLSIYKRTEKKNISFIFFLLCAKQSQRYNK